MRRIPLIVILLLLLIRPSLAVDIDTCDTTIAVGQTGVLQNDLTCDDAAYAVTLLDDATLDLNGHSITGFFLPWQHDERQEGNVIECSGDCTIVGPGEIHDAVGPGEFPVFGTNADAIRFAIYKSRVRVTVRDLSIRNCNAALHGNYSRKTRVRARVVLSNVRITDNMGAAVTLARTIDAANVTADRNLIGFAAPVVRGTNVHASDNVYAGILATRVVIDGLIAQGNGSSGVDGGVVRLTNSTVTGNTWYGAPRDIVSRRRPRLTDSTCTVSQRARAAFGKTWKVCTDDD